MSEYIIKVECNDEMFDYANAQYTHFFGYPITEEIVRCRDCRHFTPRGTHKFVDGKVNDDYCDYVRGWMLQITPDGFCKWGVRK